jgi:hypothetical protein
MAYENRVRNMGMVRRNMIDIDIYAMTNRPAPDSVSPKKTSFDFGTSLSAEAFSPT